MTLSKKEMAIVVGSSCQYKACCCRVKEEGVIDGAELIARWTLRTDPPDDSRRKEGEGWEKEFDNVLTPSPTRLKRNLFTKKRESQVDSATNESPLFFFILF